MAIAATVHPGTVLGRAARPPACRWIGKRSYSLYLWHWPIFVYTQPEIDHAAVGCTARWCCASSSPVIAAELSYRYVEVPIRNGAFGRWRQRLQRRHGARRRAGPIVFGSAAGLLLVAVNTVGASGSTGIDELTGQGDDAGGDRAGDATAAGTTVPGASPASAAPDPGVTATTPATSTTRPRRRRRRATASGARSRCSATRCCSAPRSS